MLVSRVGMWPVVDARHWLIGILVSSSEMHHAVHASQKRGRANVIICHAGELLNVNHTTGLAQLAQGSAASGRDSAIPLAAGGSWFDRHHHNQSDASAAQCSGPA